MVGELLHDFTTLNLNASLLSLCQHVTMENERIFSADQIKVHPELAKILREYTKSVIKANPEDVLEFSWNYFKKKVDDEQEAKLQAWKESEASQYLEDV